MSYESDERYTVYEERLHTAHKQHTCDACGRPISPGDVYCSVFTLWSDGSDSLKRCGACQKTHEHLRELCKSIEYLMWPDERLACGLDYAEEWGDDPPEEIAALAFASDEERGKLLTRVYKRARP